MIQFKFHVKKDGKEYVFLIRGLEGVDENTYQVFVNGDDKATIRKTASGWKEPGIRRITDRSVEAIGKKIDNYLDGNWRDRIDPENK
ncbi:MAG: hypothetical protein H7Y13_11935 [Sphingobacteriaceae bacterium]|nr:hypothetical protein [Sphingobacteriaceae bacterium]